MTQFILEFYYPWLVAAAITLLILIPIFRLVVKESTDQEKKEMKWGSALTISLVILACLGLGLFFTVPKYRQAYPTSTSSPIPMPALQFPGRLIFDTVTLSDGHRKDFAELTGQGGTAVIVTRDTDVSIHALNTYSTSPTGKYILVYDRNLEDYLLLETQTWSVARLNKEAGDPSFSPDENWIAYANGKLLLQDRSSRKITNLIDNKCAQYKVISGSDVSYELRCIGVGIVRWDDASHLFFTYHPGVFDDAFEFPETPGGLGAQGRLGIAEIDGSLIQTLDFPYEFVDMAGETLLGADPAGGPAGFDATQYVWFERNDLLNGTVTPHPIQSPDGFDGRVALSPDGTLLFMSPNFVLNLRQGTVTALEHPETERTQNCRWYPGGGYIACKYGFAQNRQSIQIYSLSGQATQSFKPDWVLFNLTAWASK